MALPQQALQEEVVQLVQECVHSLQDQTLAALSLMTQIFQVPFCSPAIPMIIQALEAQQAIGMEWALQGMVSLQWHQLEKPDPNIPQAARNWIQLILKQFWKMAWQLWQTRNDTIHNLSIMQSKQCLRGEVTKEFQQGIYLLP